LLSQSFAKAHFEIQLV